MKPSTSSISCLDVLLLFKLLHQNLYMCKFCLFSLSRSLFRTKHTGSLLNRSQEVSACTCMCVLHLMSGRCQACRESRTNEDGSMVVQLADNSPGKLTRTQTPTCTHTRTHTEEDQTARKDETDSPKPATWWVAPKWIFHSDFILVCVIMVPLEIHLLKAM